MHVDFLKERVVWITGGTSGIGLELARRLAEMGSRVAVTSRIKDKVKRAAQALAAGDRYLGIAGDLTDPEQVEKIVNRIGREWGRVDALIHCAGGAQFAPVLETDLDLWRRMIDANLTSGYLCTRAVLPYMVNQKDGHLVFILSVAAAKAFAHCSAYGAAKAGLRMFADVLREEVRTQGIRVTSVLPGATDTPLWDGVAGDFPRDRMMKPASIAAAVLAALSDPDAMLEEIVLRPIRGDL